MNKKQNQVTFVSEFMPNIKKMIHGTGMIIKTIPNLHVKVPFSLQRMNPAKLTGPFIAFAMAVWIMETDRIF